MSGGSYKSREKAAFEERMKAQPVIKHEKMVSTYSASPPSLTMKPTNTIPFALKSKPPIETVSPLIENLLFDIIALLKSEDREFNREEIKRKTGMDFRSSDKLWEAIKQNPVIYYNPENKTVIFKPPYHIKSVNDLFQLLKDKRSEGGMQVDKELKESSSKLLEYIEALAKSGDIMILTNKDLTPRRIFYADSSIKVQMSEEFRTMWHNIPIPVEEELSKELEKAGLKTMDTFTIQKPTVKAPKARRRRKVDRITNTHLEGIDLTKDYVPIV